MLHHPTQSSSSRRTLPGAAVLATLALASAAVGLGACADKKLTPAGGPPGPLALAAHDSGPQAPTPPAGSEAPAQADDPADRSGPTPVHGYRVVAEFPHDRRAFTQGLVFADGRLYESTGRHGASSVREVDLVTGELLQNRRLSSSYFAEGLASVGDRLIQLTWMHGQAFVYDRDTLEKTGELRYEGEGWGLTYDGERLILSDGSFRLRFHDPETFAPLGSVTVTDNGVPITKLNELEFIGGEVWANVWQEDRIARIDPVTGRVNSWVDLSGIIELTPVLQLGEPQNVLNGIAWEPRTESLFVTGKYWPKLFQIEVVE